MVDPDGRLSLRCGLRWTVDIAPGAVVAFRPPTADERSAPKGAVDLRPALPATTWRVLELRDGAPARGPYGIMKTVRRLAVTVDDPDGFAAALAASGTMTADPDSAGGSARDRSPSETP